MTSTGTNRSRRRVAALAILIAAGAVSGGAVEPVSAHEVDGLVPVEPGIAVGVAAAAGWLQANRPTPAPRLAGLTTLGDTPDDRRGWGVEHATAGIGIRWRPWLTSVFVAGWHGTGAPHVEAAWVQVELADPLRPSTGGRGLFIGAGRERLPTGDVIGRAGHLDRFGQAPLAKRAAFNGDWIDDGFDLHWQPGLVGRFGSLDAIGIGGWRGRRFPGSADGPVAPLLHLRGRIGPVGVDGFVSRLRPDGRGSFVQREDSGHVHSAPRCDQGLSDIACFNGRVDLVGASLDWAAPWPGGRIEAAVIHRREQGELFSANGSTRYRGRSTGGWIDLTWAPRAHWETGLRQEWLGANNRVDGVGATRVANDANLLPDPPSRRVTAMLAWLPTPSWRVAIEVGRESIAGIGTTVAGLRLVWTPHPRTIIGRPAPTDGEAGEVGPRRSDQRP